jgi:hypothetical protein
MSGCGRGRRAVLRLLVLALFAPALAPAGNTDRFLDPASGLTGWSWEGEGLLLQQVQRTPEQVRGLLQGSGLDGRGLVDGCAFELLVANTGDGELELDLEGWRVEAGGGPQPLAIGPLWRAHDRPEAGSGGRIDTRWTFFPLRQQFLPTDWSRGLVLYPLPAGSRFDLQFDWRSEGKSRRGVLRGTQCAAPHR